MAAPKIKAAFLPRFCDGVCGGGAAAVVYCRRHAAFFCGGCDCAGHGQGHERVWVCEVCEQAPAAVTCRADAAALCESCDGDIHSANPLAHRHERRPIVPFVEPIAAVKSAAFIDSPAVGKFHDEEDFLCSRVDLMAELLCGDGDLLGFGFEGERNEMEKITLNQSLAFGDSVVPSESKVDLRFGEEELMMMNHRAFESSSFEIDFSQPEKHHNNLISSNEQLLISSSFNYSAQHSASSSETGVVPDGTTNSTSEVSYTFTNSTASAGAGEVVDGGSSAAPGAPAKEMDRKARVLRYREKRKNRKFQKTIRYASRKAYAETRPRIKGRFAKRTELNETTSEEMIEQLYGFGSGSGAGGFFVEHVGYGVVPSF